MVFERKKVQTEILGEFLRSARESLNLSLTEAAKQTGIKQKFLDSLENGSFQNLPADVYVFGFLHQLAALYSADPAELVAQFKKEKGIELQISKPGKLAGTAKYQKFLGKLVITPKILSLVAGLLFVVLTVAYIVWQVLSINKTPSLEIYSPANNSVIISSSLEVRGRTDPADLVSVNEESVFVNNQGQFETQISLTPGPKTIVIAATNRFGKAVSQTLNVTSAPAVASSTPLTLKINFNSAAVLTVAVDDQAQQTLSFNGGDSKTFTARQKIILSTTDAGATVFSINGQNLGAMGKPKEQLNNISFFAPPASAESSPK